MAKKGRTTLIERMLEGSPEGRRALRREHPEGEIRFAHTFALMAIEALMNVEPKKNSHAGRLLVGIAKAVSGYEDFRFPITPKQKREAKASKLPHY